MEKKDEVSGVFIDPERYCYLKNAIDKIKEGDYKSRDGISIEEEVAFKYLQEMAENQKKQPYFIFCFTKYPCVGLLHCGLLDQPKPYWNLLPFYVRWLWLRLIGAINNAIHLIDWIDKHYTHKFALDKKDQKNT